MDRFTALVLSPLVTGGDPSSGAAQWELVFRQQQQQQPPSLYISACDCLGSGNTTGCQWDSSEPPIGRTPHPTCWTENTRYLDLIKHKITYSVSVDTDECKKYSAVCVREAVSRQCSVQFIFISGGNNNYQMKNEDSRDNDCNDRIMTRC